MHITKTIQQVRIHTEWKSFTLFRFSLTISSKREVSCFASVVPKIFRSSGFLWFSAKSVNIWSIPGVESKFSIADSCVHTKLVCSFNRWRKVSTEETSSKRAVNSVDALDRRIRLLECGKAASVFGTMVLPSELENTADVTLNRTGSDRVRGPCARRTVASADSFVFCELVGDAVPEISS